MEGAGDNVPRVDQNPRINAPLSAIHSLGQLAQGNEDAIQKLIDLQDVAGAPDAIKGVDFESLSKQEALELIDQVREESNISSDQGQPATATDGVGGDRPRPKVDMDKAKAKVRGAAQNIGQKIRR